MARSGLFSAWATLVMNLSFKLNDDIDARTYDGLNLTRGQPVARERRHDNRGAA